MKHTVKINNKYNSEDFFCRVYMIRFFAEAVNSNHKQNGAILKRQVI